MTHAHGDSTHHSTQWVGPGEGASVREVAALLGLTINDDRPTALRVHHERLSEYAKERARTAIEKVAGARKLSEAQTRARRGTRDPQRVKGRHTCLDASCEQDTGSADRPFCPRHTPPAPTAWEKRCAKRAATADEPYSARDYWNNVREARADTGERDADGALPHTEEP